MPRRRPQPDKAYKNLAFLNSPDARTLRILAEYLEPLGRFRQENVRDTVVFFGSARIRSLKETGRRHGALKRKVEAAKRPGAKLKRELAAAEAGMEMSRYYRDARELARLLTDWSLGLKDGRRFVVCSGGGPGIMEAVNRGAVEAGGEVDRVEYQPFVRAASQSLHFGGAEFRVVQENNNELFLFLSI